MDEHICAMCNAHWDYHSRDDLSCPAYIAADGTAVFSRHHFTERPLIGGRTT